jgi:uncharacterized protein
LHETEQLLALQDVDTAVDECVNRRIRLPERQALTNAHKLVANAGVRLKQATAEGESATARIEELERAGTARDVKKARLAQQLKTVIATREAEALMHEISTLDAERSAADDEELSLMDSLEASESAVAAATTDLDEGMSITAAAQEALAAAEAAVDAEIAGYQAQREVLTGDLPTALVTRYEGMRKSFRGVVISRIAAGRCGACHLDQSRTTIEALRAGDGATVECEQCGRLLAS